MDQLAALHVTPVVVRTVPRCRILGAAAARLTAARKLGRLIERMCRHLSVKHLANNGSGLQIAEYTVRGQISADLEADERTPLLVIDGREVSWEEFGRTLMTFEGWQFRMEIVDLSDEV